MVQFPHQFPRLPDAILNAVTYQLDPFAVQTAQNRGSDKRTRLAIFGTGFRYAGNPTHDPSGTVT